jgi:hypothetical protein
MNRDWDREGDVGALLFALAITNAWAEATNHTMPALLANFLGTQCYHIRARSHFFEIPSPFKWKGAVLTEALVIGFVAKTWALVGKFWLHAPLLPPLRS